MNIRGILSVGEKVVSKVPDKNFMAQVNESSLNRISRLIFRQANEPKSSFLVTLNRFDSSGLEMTPEAERALKLLKEKATMFADRMDRAIACGKEPAAKDYYKDFQRVHSDLFQTISDFLETKLTGSYYDEGYQKIWELKKSLFRPARIKSHADLMYCGKITQTEKSILPADGIFYHGTKHEHRIEKEGFRTRPKFIQEFLGMSRELGDGVYFSPEKEVAAFFAGLNGGVVKAKVNNLKPASINSRQLSSMIDEIYGEFGADANIDKLIKELFKRNGYNAAYAQKELSKHLVSASIDTVIGKPQSQLAVYNPQDICILSKTKSERRADTFLQFKKVFPRLSSIFGGK